MKVNIRIGNENDFPAILELIHELAEFERASDKVLNTVERMEKDKGYFSFFVAELDGEIVGHAIYYPVYFTWVGRSMYLDDLYVKEIYRGKGIGSKLLDKVLGAAREQECQRLRWQVLDWNEDAIRFYEKIGARIEKEWYNCDVDAVGIQEIRL